MGTIIIVALIFAAAGFVAGALVFRNNEKKADAIVSTVQNAATDVKQAGNAVGQAVADIKKVQNQ